jgi:hypothetical protein
MTRVMGLWKMDLRLIKRMKMKIWKTEECEKGCTVEYLLLAGLLIIYFSYFYVE